MIDLQAPPGSHTSLAKLSEPYYVCNTVESEQQMTFDIQNQTRIQELEGQLQACRSDAALVIHALDCAIQLVGTLIAFTPDGSPVHPGVSLAKEALDNAMAAIHGRRK